MSRLDYVEIVTDQSLEEIAEIFFGSEQFVALVTEARGANGEIEIHKKDFTFVVEFSQPNQVQYASEKYGIEPVVDIEIVFGKFANPLALIQQIMDGILRLLK